MSNHYNYTNIGSLMIPVTVLSSSQKDIHLQSSLFSTLAFDTHIQTLMAEVDMQGAEMIIESDTLSIHILYLGTYI